MLNVEHRLRVLENRVLRRIFEPKKDDAYEELHNLCYSPNVIMMRCSGHVACMAEMRNVYDLLGGKP
jgi:hypothetical protein